MLANNLIPININITKKMMINIKFSRQRYTVALEETACKILDKILSKKAADKINSGDYEKKKDLRFPVEYDINFSDKLIIQAEMEKDFFVHEMSNFLKELVKAKEIKFFSKEKEILKEKCLT